MIQRHPSAIILYHFFYPDDVVSARHFSQYAEELAKRGWKVTVLTSNRFCHYSEKKINQRSEVWRGIHILRIRRPGWTQANRYLRLANSLWMITGWGWKLCRIPPADAIIIGSDPPFSAFLFPFLRFFKRAKILVHWCYDLYPEAIIADGAKGFSKWFAIELTFLMKWVYRSVDLMVDIGACMRKRLRNYNPRAHSATLVPWSLIEPDSIQEPEGPARHELFNNAKLALLYSGNMGKAHDFSLFLELARKICKKDSRIIFCFACRGSRFKELKQTIRPNDDNIRFAPFADESELGERLVSADIHLISLRPEWEGIVVPSKYFGSLAVGRPVIYAGPENSAIGTWIREFHTGLELRKDNMEDIAEKLLEIANQPNKMRVWQENAFKAYQRFSKTSVMNQWDKLLRDLIEGR